MASSYDSENVLSVGSLGFPSTGYQLGVDSSGNVYSLQMSTNTLTKINMNAFTITLSSLTTGTFYVGIQYAMTAVFSISSITLLSVIPPNSSDSISNMTQTGSTVTFNWTPQTAVTNYFQFVFPTCTVKSSNYTTSILPPCPQWVVGTSTNLLTVSKTTQTNDTITINYASGWAYSNVSLSAKIYWEFSVVSCTNYYNNAIVELGIIDKTQFSAFSSGNSDSTPPYIKYVWGFNSTGVFQGNDEWSGGYFTGYTTSPSPPTTLPTGSIIGIGFNFTSHTTSLYLYQSGSLTFSCVEEAWVGTFPNVTNYIPFLGASNRRSNPNIVVQMVQSTHTPSGYTALF